MDISFPQNSGAVPPVQTEPACLNQLAEHRELIQAVRTVNGSDLMGQNSELSFLLDRETRRPVLRLVDRKTNQVIRQIPPEYVLQMAKEWRAKQR